MEQLTIQAFINEQWLDIAIISFPESDQHNYKVTAVDYLQSYAIDHFEKDDLHASPSTTLSLFSLMTTESQVG